jgi:hypothetical protein
MQPPHDRIAKRRAEIADQLSALDREDAQRRATDADPAAAVVERRTGSAVRDAVFLILLIAVAAGLLGVGVTLNRLAGNDFADAKRQGTAQVTSCVRQGPISNKGFGYWHRCTATITWDDGSTNRLTVGAVFTPTDIRTQVRVGDLGTYRTSPELVRAGSPHRPWLAGIGIAVGVIAFIPALVATLIIRELLRFRRRHHRAAS